MSARRSQAPKLRALPYACSYEALVDLFKRERRADRPLLICIDGGGASGKSTIANRLAAASEDIQVVHLDDFYRPSSDRYVGSLTERPIGADFDLNRLRAELLVPLRSGFTSSYHVCDWGTDQVS